MACCTQSKLLKGLIYVVFSDIQYIFCLEWVSYAGSISHVFDLAVGMGVKCRRGMGFSSAYLPPNLVGHPAKPIISLSTDHTVQEGVI